MAKKKVNNTENDNEKLFMKRQSVFEKYSKEYQNDSYEFCEEYKTFLDNSKTERESIQYITELLINKNFLDIDKLSKEQFKKKKSYKGLYRIVHNKAILIYVNGKESIIDGINIIGAHIDSPRIDLKPNPLFEGNGLTYFKTHYYGGIKSINGLLFHLQYMEYLLRKMGRL